MAAAATQRAYLTDGGGKATTIKQPMCNAYPFFEDASRPNDFRLDGGAGFTLTKKDFKLLGRPPFVTDDPFPPAPSVIRGVTTPREAGILMGKAVRLLARPATKTALLRATARTALHRPPDTTHSEHPWLLEPRALVLGRALITLRVNGKDLYYPFSSGPAITARGTRHPFVWQVLFPGAGKGAKLAGLICGEGGATFNFLEASHPSFDAFVHQYLEGEGLWAATDVEVLHKHKDKITSFFSGLVEHAGIEGAALAEEGLCLALGEAPRLVRPRNELPRSAQLPKAPSEAQQAFAAAVAHTVGGGGGGWAPVGAYGSMWATSVTVGTIPDAAWQRPSGSQSFEITGIRTLPRVSQCWLCGRSLSACGEVLGQRCRGYLLELLQRLGEQSLEERILEDPAAAKAILEAKYTASRVNEEMMQIRDQARSGSGTDEEEEDIASEGEGDTEEEEEASDTEGDSDGEGDSDSEGESDSDSDTDSDSDSEGASQRKRKRSRA
jgi:hypothetical protein